MPYPFSGAGVSLITPFHKYGTVDFTSLGQLIENVINRGIDYIVFLGPTGEVSSLSNDETNAIIEFVSDVVNNRVPTILGIMADNTQEAVNKIKGLNGNLVDAIMCPCPSFFNVLKHKGILYHFKEIACVSEIPVIIYNGAKRYGTHIAAETILELADNYKNIIGVKDTSENFREAMEILSKKREDFIYLSGIDTHIFPLLALGANGGISVLANAFPQKMATLIKAGLQGNINEARNMHYQMYPLFNILAEDCTIAAIKAILNQEQKCQNYLRLPLVKVNKSNLYKINQLLKSQQEVMALA